MRSNCQNNTRRGDTSLREDTVACHTAKVEGILAFVEVANVALEDLSTQANMTKQKVDYL